MKTLAEHNAQAIAAQRKFEESTKTHPNGIACPECGKELWDSNPMEIFTSNPPQKHVNCPDCGFRGYRIA